VPTADELRTALAHLSFNQRSALVMRELEGRSYAEIGAILELSVSAVETLLFRARRALREQLEGALTCGEAEATLSRRMDGRLPVAEQRLLRAHLRECAECASLERKLRARRSAVKGLGVVQLPPSLASFLGGGGAATGGAAVGTGIVAKAVAVLAAGVVAGGVGHEAVQAVAAPDPSRSPLPELRVLPRSFPAAYGQAVAPGTPASVVRAAVRQTATPGAAVTTALETRSVREKVHGALVRGPAQRSTPPQAPASASAPAAAQPVGVQPPAAPEPVRQVTQTARRTVDTTLETARTVVKTVLPPQPQSPPPPLPQLPPIQPPQLPPPPPLPPLLP
jgi:hypothetical protein